MSLPVCSSAHYTWRGQARFFFPSLMMQGSLSLVAPMIWVQNQLEYAILGRNVSLHCKTESYPQAIHYWRLRNGTSISSGDKYRVQTEAKKFGTLLTLTIKNVSPYDFGVYECIAKNPLGQSDGKINLSGELGVVTFFSYSSCTYFLHLCVH